MHGVVVKNTGSWYVVLTDEGKSIDCKIKGNFRLKGIRSTNPVAVGDLVDIVPTQGGTAFITNIRERKNYVIRKAANLWLPWLTLRLPPLSLTVSWLRPRPTAYRYCWCSTKPTCLMRMNGGSSR